MALFQRKPLEQLSPAYRRRIERYEAQGLTRSQARGHSKTTEFSVRQLRIASAPDNTQYLLKRVLQLKDPNLIKQFNQLQKLSAEAKRYPKGFQAHKDAAAKRDELARDLAHKIRNIDGGQDLYAVATWGKKYTPSDLESEEDIDIDEEF